MSLVEMVEIGYSLFVLSQVHSHFGVTMNLLIPFYVFSHERWPSSLGPLIPPSAWAYQKVCVGWGFREVLSTYMGVEGPQSFGFPKWVRSKKF